MGLRYTFRQLFYGNRFHKDRMWKTLEELDERISELDGDSSTSYDDTEVKALISALDERITALETPSQPSEPNE
jgi:uncharacterized protein YdcH (DUF465 family)